MSRRMFTPERLSINQSASPQHEQKLAARSQQKGHCHLAGSRPHRSKKGRIPESNREPHPSVVCTRAPCALRVYHTTRPIQPPILKFLNKNTATKSTIDAITPNPNGDCMAIGEQNFGGVWNVILWLSRSVHLECPKSSPHRLEKCTRTGSCDMCTITHMHADIAVMYHSCMPVLISVQCPRDLLAFLFTLDFRPLQSPSHIPPYCCAHRFIDDSVQLPLHLNAYVSPASGCRNNRADISGAPVLLTIPK